MLDHHDNSNGTDRSAVACNLCGTAVPAERFGDTAPFCCAGCQGTLQLELYPAFYRAPQPLQRGEAATAEGEAVCYNHPLKKATVFCDACGRFLCSLCELRIGATSLCPDCVERGVKDGARESLVTTRTLYDSLSLSLSIFPMLLVFPTVVTAPVSIYLAIRYWNRPGSLLPRSRFRLVCALLCSSLQVIGWGAFLVSRL